MAYPTFIFPRTPVNLPIQRCPVPRRAASQRILIMRLGSYGDILMATPLLAALRASYPTAYITWMVEHSAQGAIDANPYIDEILVWDGGYWNQMLENRQFVKWLRAAMRFGTMLRCRRFGTFISYHAEQWPSLTWATAAKRSIGVHGIFRQFDAPNETNKKWYTNWYSWTEGLPLHHTDIYLLALKALGLPDVQKKQMSLGYTAEAAKTADDFLHTHFLPDGSPLVVIAPQTTWETRCWPEDRYVALGDRLASLGCRLVLIGSASEQEVVERIAAQMREKPAIAAGTFGFSEMTALIARASLCISGDTGPMHVAAAVGTPYLALFGPTPVQGRAPLAGRGLSLFHSVPCGPCDLPVCSNMGDDHNLCMRLLSVEEVLRAAEYLTHRFHPLKDIRVLI